MGKVSFTVTLSNFCLLSIFPDIEDLPPTVQEKLFDEVLDRDVQKGKCSENG